MIVIMKINVFRGAFMKLNLKNNIKNHKKCKLFKNIDKKN